ncbi:5-bromo-4-chloroindolyl phosphate hydrolysis family protein [Clostridium minihomine]|uniref:5-bromo-4-chloroindolyl phosphate hydrolysis family protein n=1 Tax=Clostridium minihomine TaxID=2045012 RepID=UPI000C755DAC|nr:5-bromo-4-chloroindolyl phosphate hydrolysis family protein [Clostridium minihomine]
MRQITQKSVIPIYAAAAVWLIWGLLLPLYHTWHFLLVAVLSAAVYFVMNRVFPPKILWVEEKPKPANTEDSDADAVINDGRAQLERLRQLDQQIADSAVSAHIVRICGICEKIFAYLEDKPKKAPQLRLFFNYYLPTTLKLLESYQRMAAQNISGENIRSAMRGVEGILSSIEQAFEKQLDHLFADEALDISTDITVLENMMAREGLTKDPFDNQTH